MSPRHFYHYNTFQPGEVAPWHAIAKRTFVRKSVRYFLARDVEPEAREPANVAAANLVAAQLRASRIESPLLPRRL